MTLPDSMAHLAESGILRLALEHHFGWRKCRVASNSLLHHWLDAPSITLSWSSNTLRAVSSSPRLQCCGSLWQGEKTSGKMPTTNACWRAVSSVTRLRIALASSQWNLSCYFSSQMTKEASCTAREHLASSWPLPQLLSFLRAPIWVSAVQTPSQS